jgi:hypothetical protein
MKDVFEVRGVDSKLVQSSSDPLVTATSFERPSIKHDLPERDVVHGAVHMVLDPSATYRVTVERVRPELPEGCEWDGKEIVDFREGVRRRYLVVQLGTSERCVRGIFSSGGHASVPAWAFDALREDGQL